MRWPPRLLERAVASEAPAPVWFDLGLVRQDLRDHEAAATAYRKALELKPDYAEAALNLGTVLQESGDLDGAMRAYAQAYRLRPQMFGTIAMALTSAPHGRLWLDEAALRRSLEDGLKSDPVARESACDRRRAWPALRQRSSHRPPVRLIKTLEYELGRGARDRKALRHRRALRQHAGKIRLRPERREIDAAVVKAIGIHQARDQAKRQFVAIYGMGGEQRPAGLKLDGPEAVELDRGLPCLRKRRVRELGRDMKAQGRARMSRCRGLRNSPVPGKRAADRR